MATTVSIALGNVCTGGGHFRINAALDGGGSQSFDYVLDEMRTQPTADQMRDAVLVIIRLHLKGLSGAQARAALQAGFSVVV